MATLIEAGRPHAAVMAALHARAFDVGWTEASYDTLLASPGIFALIALDPPKEPAGMVMLRETADEAEFLILCTDPDRRRQGIARMLFLEGLSRLAEEVERCFFEVAENNFAARTLYENCGGRTVGRRPGYYETDEGRVDALIMVWERANGHVML